MSEILFGMHAVQAILERSPERILEVFVLNQREDKRLMALLAEIKQIGIKTKTVDRKWLDDQTQKSVHQGILIRVKPAPSYHENDLDRLIEAKTNPLILILDGVTDPHNLGACLRTADAAGVDLIIVPKDRSAPMNATVKKVACGAGETVPLIRVTNLARTMRQLKEDHHIWIVGTAGEATQTIYESKLKGRLALVMGAEGEGMRRLTREHCDELVKIPMAGSVSSLNVSVATGICLFEIVRQNSAL